MSARRKSVSSGDNPPRNRPRSTEPELYVLDITISQFLGRSLVHWNADDTAHFEHFIKYNSDLHSLLGRRSDPYKQVSPNFARTLDLSYLYDDLGIPIEELRDLRNDEGALVTDVARTKVLSKLTKTINYHIDNQDLQTGLRLGRRSSSASLANDDRLRERRPSMSDTHHSRTFETTLSPIATASSHLPVPRPKSGRLSLPIRSPRAASVAPASSSSRSTPQPPVGVTSRGRKKVDASELERLKCVLQQEEDLAERTQVLRKLTGED
jgi:hypothetical protein